MDKEGFIQYLKNKGKERGIPHYLRLISVLENYLNEYTKHKDLDKITPDEFREFITKSKEGFKSNQDLNPIIWYYLFTENQEIYNLSIEYSGIIGLEKYKLSQFMGIDKEITTNLKKVGIKTAAQMLEKGATEADRKEIAEQTGIPAEKILELVKLANLAKVPGHKRKRARLYLNAGIDTLEKMAKLSPEKLIKIAEDYIQKNGFDGSAPIYADAKFSIDHAKHIKDVVEF